jgi:uncharacterized protein YkwD
MVAVAAVPVVAAAPVSQPAEVGVQALRVDPPADSVDPDEEISREMVDLLNERRRAYGLPAVSWDSRVHEAAQTHAVYQASIGYLTHYGADGSDTGDRLDEAGFTWGSWGENAAGGQLTPAEVTGAWMTSPTHFDIMLGDFTVAAGGVAEASDGVLFWTLVMTTPG